MSIKQSLLLLIILVAVDLPVLQAQTTQATNAANTPISANAVSERQANSSAVLKDKQSSPSLTAEMEVLLKYQEFLRKESDQNAAQLNSLIQHTKDWIRIVGACFIGIAIVLTFIVGKSLKDVKKLIEERADKEFQEKTQEALDKRLNETDKRYSKRHEKYLKQLGRLISVLFETNPTFAEKWVGQYGLKSQDLKGKQVLWVDDDRSGIVHFIIALENYCGAKIEVVDTTEKALDEASATKYDLFISNLRRGLHNDEGVRFTRQIRQRHKNIPVIIFTQPRHAETYMDEIMKAGANEVACADSEIFCAIFKLLMSSTPDPGKSEGQTLTNTPASGGS